MDPTRKNKSDKSVAKPGNLENNNDHDAPEVISETDDNTDEELMSEVETNNKAGDENEIKNNKNGKIVNNDSSILENSDRPGESEDGSI